MCAAIVTLVALSGCGGTGGSAGGPTFEAFLLGPLPNARTTYAHIDQNGVLITVLVPAKTSQLLLPHSIEVFEANPSGRVLLRAANAEMNLQKSGASWYAQIALSPKNLPDGEEITPSKMQEAARMLTNGEAQLRVYWSDKAESELAVLGRLRSRAAQGNYVAEPSTSVTVSSSSTIDIELGGAKLSAHIPFSLTGAEATSIERVALEATPNCPKTIPPPPPELERTMSIRSVSSGATEAFVEASFAPPSEADPRFMALVKLHTAIREGRAYVRITLKSGASVVIRVLPIYASQSLTAPPCP
jgi:hypothetical protein